MNYSIELRKLINSFWVELPELNKVEIKEVVRIHLYELIERTPKAHVRKLAKYRSQLILLNKLYITQWKFKNK